MLGVGTLGVMALGPDHQSDPAIVLAAIADDLVAHPVDLDDGVLGGFDGFDGLRASHVSIGHWNLPPMMVTPSGVSISVGLSPLSSMAVTQSRIPARQVFPVQAAWPFLIEASIRISIRLWTTAQGSMSCKSAASNRLSRACCMASATAASALLSVSMASSFILGMGRHPSLFSVVWFVRVVQSRHLARRVMRCQALCCG